MQRDQDEMNSEGDRFGVVKDDGMKFDQVRCGFLVYSFW